MATKREREEIRELLQKQLEIGEKLPHKCYRHKLGELSSPKFSSLLKDMSCANPHCEQVLEVVSVTPQDLEEIVAGSRNTIVCEDNFNDVLLEQKKSFTLADLIKACEEYDEEGIKVHKAKSQKTYTYFLKKGMPKDTALACAFAISFYTGYKSEHVNRAASLVARQGNGEAVTFENKNHLPILYFLVNALSNLPFYWGETIRAINLTEDELCK
jgi:hypothetical protein